MKLTLVPKSPVPCSGIFRAFSNLKTSDPRASPKLTTTHLGPSPPWCSLSRWYAGTLYSPTSCKHPSCPAFHSLFHMCSVNPPTLPKSVVLPWHTHPEQHNIVTHTHKGATWLHLRFWPQISNEDSIFWQPSIPCTHLTLLQNFIWCFILGSHFILFF